MPSADALFLVLEYLPGGVLMSMTPGEEQPAQPPFSRERTREYFRQLCLGLEYLHWNGIIHRDVGRGSVFRQGFWTRGLTKKQIKPENVLVSGDGETVKLCDFRVSEMFIGTGDDRIKKSGGSPAFLSPESFTCTCRTTPKKRWSSTQAKTASSQEIHGKAVDIWALGELSSVTPRLPAYLQASPCTAC